MRIYLVQHGTAKPKEEDPTRNLDGQGSEDSVRVSGLLSLFEGPQPTCIIHSGMARARQTAELMAQQLQVELVEEGTDLAPNADPSLWAKRLNEMNEEIMLVGHLPYLNRLASLLLCGDAEGDLVQFSNAGVLCLERDGEKRYRIVWMLVPGLLRRL